MWWRKLGRQTHSGSCAACLFEELLLAEGGSPWEGLHLGLVSNMIVCSQQLWTNNKVCHKLPYEAGRFRHAVLAINVCHNSLANGLASFGCNNKVCHSLDGTLGARESAYDPERT